MKKTTIFAAVTLLVALAASSAHAGDSASIDLDVQAPGFDSAALRAALEADLGQSVFAPGQGASVHLFVTEVNGKIIAGIHQGDRQVTRSLELSANRAVAQETLELVLAAMMRTESAAHAPPPAAPPPAAPPTAAPPPAAPPNSPALQQRDTGATDASGPIIPFAMDLAPFVGVSSATRARDTRFVSIGAVGTLSRNLYGLGVNGAIGITTQALRGMSVSGAVDVARTTGGAQIAGAASVTVNEMAGAQISGAVNVAGDVAGVQIAGALNVARGDVDGVQISGAVNVATGHVHGAQIGVINIADEADAPIGIFNVIKHGRHHVDVWGSDTGLVMVGAQLGGKYTHAILGVGMRPGPDGPRFAFGGGIGVHVDASERLGIDVDLLHHDLSAFSPASQFVQLSQARVLFDVEAWPRVRFFAGPTFNVLVSNDPKDTNPSVFGSWGVGQRGTTHVAVWPGLTIGSRLL